MVFTPIVIWWFVILIFGLAGWPLAFSLLRHLPDRGFAFARPVGLLIAGYILWLGGTFRLLQNNVGGILVALLLVLTMGLIWQRQQRQAGNSLPMLLWLKQEWRYALTVELLFSLAFAGWAVFKAYNPNIETSGGEKWMEIAFINGVLRSDYFPPQDPWLSGFAISYYYFGYVLMAMVTQLTGLVSTIAFNLYIPTLFALTLTAAFSIVANLVNLYQASLTESPIDHAPLPTGGVTNNVQNFSLSAMFTGLVAALFVAILGNLEGLLEVLHKRGLFPASFWIWLDIRDLKIPPPGPSESWIPDRFIWWWRGSRVLTDYTLAGHEQEVIDEFPFFSFLLGDVHPHVLALPFVLLVVALALNLLANGRPGRGRQSLVGRGQHPATGSQRSTASGQLLALSDQPIAVGSQPLIVGSQALAISQQPVASSRPVAVDTEPQTTDHEQPTKNIIDKSLETLRQSWSELLEATGGRLAVVLYALCLGSLSFLNTWDFPIYLSVVSLSLIAWLAYRRDNGQLALQSGLIDSGILGLMGILLYLPFYATFQSQARGILPNLWNPTRLPQFFVFFGPFLVATIALLTVLSGKTRDWVKHISWSVPLTVLGPVLIMLLALSAVLISPAGRDYVQGIIRNPEVQQVIGEATVGALVQESLWRRLMNPWTFLFVGILLGWALALFMSLVEAKPTAPEAWQTPGEWLAEKFILILLLLGLGLPLSVEFIYLRDNFGIRMNTIFKFYFQAWVLLALVSAFAVYYVSKNLPRGLATIWQVGMSLLVAAGLVYSALAIPTKTDYFNNEPTLDGIAWVAQNRPGDYAAIEWLRANAPDWAVILEAPGAPLGEYGGYNYTGRISAMTGLPTLLGWGGHESQWRGNYDEPARREPDIELLYNTLDIGQAQMLLDKYGVTYVYVGRLEQERYSPQGLNKFAQFMNVVFEQDGVIIYQRR